MKKEKRPEKILEEYKQKTDAIIDEMLKLVYSVQRQIDDAEYKKTLEKLGKDQ